MPNYFHKGWKMVGFDHEITDLSVFDTKNVQLIWSYQNGKWYAYSPDETVQNVIETAQIDELTAIKPWHGVWVLSKQWWYDESSYQFNKDQSSKIEAIELYKGWNLLSLPYNMVISPEVFGDDVVWKYNDDSDWEAYIPNLDENITGIKSLQQIDPNNGFWVNAEEVKTIDIANLSSELQSFASTEKMENYLKLMITSKKYFPWGWCADLAYPEGAVDMVTADSGAANDLKAEDATTTNLQESGVDESDILKHNNDYIFYLNRISNQIIVTRFSKVIANETEPITTIDTDSAAYIESLYLKDDQLIVLYTPKTEYSFDFSDVENIDYWNGKSGFKVYDISDINAITLVEDFTLNGRIVNSRIVDGKLYLMSRFIPHAQWEYPKVFVEGDQCISEYEKKYGIQYDVSIGDGYFTDQYGKSHYCQKNDEGYYYIDYNNPQAMVYFLQPSLQDNINIKETTLLDATQTYAPLKLDQTPAIVSVTEFDLSDFTYNNTAIVGETTTEYVSSKAIYLVSNQYRRFWAFNDYEEQSTIYKFSIDDQLEYRGKGNVSGRILNQFSLSEYDNILRIATTEGFSWWSGSDTNNSIFTLQDSNGSLSEIGSLSSLGKEGETIRAVRFIGDRAFVVTFLQTDPFYTIDLSDPTAPEKKGELKVDGFSEYFHPIDENRILSIGRDADENGILGGLQVQLFDLTDFSNPLLADKVVIGNKYYHSEAEYNHKAFSYRNSDALFSFPVSYWSKQPGYKWQYSYQHMLPLFQIEDQSIKTIGKLQAVSENSYWYGQARPIIFNMTNDNNESIPYLAYFYDDSFTAKPISELESLDVETTIADEDVIDTP
jgi:uncharacterized secreted protein with C-terminal beta-propeller domain